MGRFKELATIHFDTAPKQLPRFANAKMPRKAAAILRILAEGGSLNRFEAERHGDHCLPSTVSNLQDRYGLRVDRTTERVPNRYGTLTSCARYRLAPDQRPRALAILKAMQGEAPE